MKHIKTIKKKNIVICTIIILILLIYFGNYIHNNVILISGLTDNQLVFLESFLKSEKGRYFIFKNQDYLNILFFKCIKFMGEGKNSIILFKSRFKEVVTLKTPEDINNGLYHAVYYDETIRETLTERFGIKKDNLDSVLIILDKAEAKDKMQYTLMNRKHKIVEEKKYDVTNEMYTIDGIDSESVEYMDLGIRSDTTIVFYIATNYLSEKQEYEIKEILNKHFSDDFQLILLDYTNSKIFKDPGAEDIKKLNEIRNKIIDLGYSDTEILNLNFGVYGRSREAMNNYSLAVNVNIDTLSKEAVDEILAVMKEYYPEIKDDYFEIINQDGWVLNRIKLPG